MENSLFLIITSFLPLVLLHLFAERNSSLAQPQRGSSISQGLEEYSLPSGTITESDMPQIKNTIQQVLDQISKPAKANENKLDYQTIKSGILTFHEWLKRQGCVSEASTTYDIETTDKYPENIFITHPGQLPFDIVFKMQGDITKPYRLMIFVTRADLFDFGTLVENKSIGGVPVPPNWPKDTWSYWDERP